jgi:hypothetical protein
MLVHLKSPRDRVIAWLGFAAGTASASAQSVLPDEPLKVAGGNEVYLWLGLGCFAVVGMLGLGRAVTGTIRRRRRGRALRVFGPDPGRRQPGGLLRWFRRSKVEPRGVRLEGWEARSRRAELKAEQAVAVLRSELTPHLARIMKDRLVWTLMTQRSRWLSSHQANAERVVTLEHRLTAIQMQIQKQAEAYESRISELEQELSNKNAVTRELLKVRVMLARQTLDAVRLDRAPDGH